MAAITTLLDLTWLTIAAISLVSLFVFEIQERQRKGTARRALAVLFSLVVLYPCISASDDLIGLALLSPRTDHQNEASILFASDSREGSDFELGVRLLALDRFQGASIGPLLTPVHFMASIPRSNPVFAGYIPHHQASRAPPTVSVSRGPTQANFDFSAFDTQTRILYGLGRPSHGATAIVHGTT